LLINPGAEAGACASDGTTLEAIPGWTTTSNFTVVCYGNSSSYPETSVSTAIGGGNGFFAGGASGTPNTATQTVDVSSATSEIDAGTVQANLSGYLGGYGTQGDNMVVTAAFLNSLGQSLSSFQIGPVLPADRNNVTTLLARSASAAVPSGTRSIRVTMTATRTDGSYNDGYADNLSLTLGPKVSLSRLTVTPSGSGSGLVLSTNPTGISCGSGSANTCTDTYPTGTAVTLNATPVSATNGTTTVFAGWSGGGCSGTGSCTVVLNADTTVTAEFDVLAANPAGDIIPPLSWSAPLQDGGVMNGDTSCPISTLCVVAGVTWPETAPVPVPSLSFTTSPSSGGKWTVDTLPGTERPTHIRCTGTTLCLLWDDSGDLYTVVNPTSGLAGWSAAGKMGDSIAGISCPTASFCAAAGDFGNSNLLLTETPTGSVHPPDPSGNAGAWVGIHVGTPYGIGAISCPSTQLCVAADNFGAVFTSTSPTGSGALPVWSNTGRVDSNSAPNTLTCLSAAFCIGGDQNGNIFSSSNPTGGPGAWTLSHIGQGIVGEITCASTSFCAALVGGELFTSTNPLGGAAAWTADQAGSVNLYSLSCTSELVHGLGASPLCVGIGPGIDLENQPPGSQIVAERPTIAVSRFDTGTGSVGSAPVGISCPTTCAHFFDAGSRITFTATPASGSVLSGWSTPCSGTGTCTVTAGATTQLAAIFSKAPVSTSGTVTVTLTGTTATLTCKLPTACSGTLSYSMVSAGLKLAGAARASRAAAVVVGRGHFRISAHKRAKVRVALTSAGRMLVRHHSLKRLALTIVTHQGKNPRTLTAHYLLGVRYSH
jgi:hypothetical protein